MPTFDELRRQYQGQQQTAVPSTAIETSTFGATSLQQPQKSPLQYQAPELKYDTPEWESARKNPQLLNTIKRYAKNVENEDFSSDEQAFDWFVGDRRWKDANTFSTLKELNFVKGGPLSKHASPEDLADLAYIRDEWEKLPGGLERIAKGNISEGVGAIIENLAKGFVDPSLLAGGFVGKGVAAVGKKAAQQGIKSITGKAVSEAAVKSGLQMGSSIATDAATTAGANLAYQETNVEVGLQKEVDGWEALKAGGLGAVLSAPGAYSTYKPKPIDVLDFKGAAEAARRVTEERKQKGLGNLFTGVTNKTPDGHVLTTEDVTNAKIPDPNAPSEPSYLDIMGEDVKNTANITLENKNLAMALANTFPGAWASKEDFFKWWGKNNRRVIDFANKYDNFADPTEIAINARAAQEAFPELFQSARRGEVSEKQTVSGAERILKNKSLDEGVDMVTNTPVGYAANDSELMAAKMVFGRLLDKKRDLKKLSLNLDGKLSEKELDDIEKQLHSYSASVINVTAKVAGFESEAGRALHSTQFSPPDTSSGKVLNFATKGIRLITSTAKSVEERKAMLKDYADAFNMLDDDNPEMLASFVAHLYQNKGGLDDKFYELYYNWGLLSNPSTQVINLVGNATTTVLENAERGLVAAFTPEERAPLAARMMGYAAGIPDAWKVAVRTFKTEIPTDSQTKLETLNKHAIPSWRVTYDANGLNVQRAGIAEPGFVVGGKQARVVGRLLMGVDEFMKMWHQRAYIYEQAARETTSLQGSAKTQAIKDFIANVPSKTLEGAVDEGRRLTYTDKSGQFLRGFQQVVNEIPGGRLIFPFVRTPAKIIKQAAEMIAPVGRTADDLAEGGLQRKRAMARLTLGYSMLASGAYIAAMGNANGSAPSDPGDRATFENSGMLPWSVRTGNTWTQFNRWDPVAIPFSIGVGLEKTLESFNASGTGLEREEGFLSTMTAFMSDALLDKSFFQGVENVVGAVMEPERKLESFGKGVVRSFVPAVTAGFARAVDPRTTAPMTFWEVIQDRVGFDARLKVPSKLDAFGREIPVEVPMSYKGEPGALNVLNRFVNPFKARSGADDPIANELYDLGIKLSPPKKRYKDIELDSNQQYVLGKAEGKQLHDGLRFVMSQPNWKDLSELNKRVIIDEIKSMAQQAGQMMLVGVYPELARRGELETNEMKKLNAPTRTQNRLNLFGLEKK